jgi:hypothetical protein
MRNDREFVGSWASAPVGDCLSIAAMRLLAASDHLDSLARLLGGTPAVYGPVAVARAALECSARAWWDLDPDLDVRGRVLRGMIDRVVSLVEGSRIPEPTIRQTQTARLAELLSAARDVGLEPRHDSRDRLVSIAGEEIPKATKIIKDQLGVRGEVAYRYLSAVLHGVL